MSCFLFVPGAWHGSWCWERITPLLEAKGHSVITPDLLGFGAAATEPVGAVELADWADQIAALVREQRKPPILVGHSRGGIIISEVAERVPNEIRLLVYLTACLLPDGAAVTAVSQRLPRGPDELAVTPGPDGRSVLDPMFVGPRFYQMAEPYWLERATRLLEPEPILPFMTPLKLTDAGFGSVPRAYIECTEDRAIPLDVQRWMQAALPCQQVVTLPTDHSPFYTAPDQLADTLMALAAAANETTPGRRTGAAQQATTQALAVRGDE